MKKMLLHNGKMVNALRWDGVNIEEVKEMVKERLMQPHLCMGFLYLFIMTDDGIVQCNEGDWIAKDLEGKITIITEEQMQSEGK